MNSKEIELQALLDHEAWINKVLNEDKNINTKKIANDLRKMRPYQLRKKTISFVK